MEKQTKILLGVGAVIAAYLILKPKNVAAQTSVATPVPTPLPNMWKTDFCASDPNSYSCYVQKGGGFMPIKRTPSYVMTQQEMEACNQDPRNCKM